MSIPDWGWAVFATSFIVTVLALAAYRAATGRPHPLVRRLTDWFERGG